jgi:hypothetical protein
MTTPAKKLDTLLAGLAAGTWVVLDPSMSRILGTARTAEGAMRKAHLPPGTAGRSGSKRPVILQIPERSVAYYL